MEGTRENKSDEFGIRAVKRPEAFGTINPFSLTIESSRRFAVALGEALLNRPQPRYEASSTHHVPQRPAHHSNAAWQACSCIVSHCWRWNPMPPAPLSLSPLQLAVGRRAGSPYKCTCTTNGIAHRRSPSVGYLPAHRRRCPQLSSPPTRQHWNAPVNIAVGKAPHHAVCRSGGHLALRCSMRKSKNSDASCRPTCHRIDGQTIFCRPSIARVHHHIIITSSQKAKQVQGTVA